MKCFVYRNLNKKMFKGTFSVKAMEGPYKGRVVAYTMVALMANVKFVVSEAGRQRVLREKQKNVHAGIVGDVCFIDNYYANRLPHTIESFPCNWDIPDNCFPQVTYNPYKYDSFVMSTDESPILTATSVYLENGKVFVI